jgi:hypothetical protein
MMNEKRKKIKEVSFLLGYVRREKKERKKKFVSQLARE